MSLSFTARSDPAGDGDGALARGAGIAGLWYDCVAADPGSGGRIAAAGAAADAAGLGEGVAGDPVVGICGTGRTLLGGAVGAADRLGEAAAGCSGGGGG